MNRQTLRAIIIPVAIVLGACPQALADPLVSNIRSFQQAGTKLVHIDYDLGGTGGPFWVSVEGSSDGGATWALPVVSLAGSVGSGIAPACNLRVTWNAGVDWGGRLSNEVRFRVVANDSPHNLLTWNEVPPPFFIGGRISGITYANGMFIAVGGRGTSFGGGGLILTSPNGHSWTNRDAAGVENEILSVAYGDGRFVATGFGDVVLTSLDGIQWVAYRLGFDELNRLSGVAYGNGKFVAVGIGNDVKGKVFVSSNGLTWTSVDAGQSVWLVDVGFHNGTFVVVGDRDQILTSSDAITWTIRNSRVPENWHTCVTHGAGQFMIAGRGDLSIGSIVTSNNAVTWTSHTPSSQWGGFFGVCYGGGYWVAVGYRGVISVSSGENDWLRNESNTELQLSDVAFGNNRFVAVGQWGKILLSSSIAP